MKKGSVFSKAIINSVTSILQVTFIGLSYFFLYKFLLVQLGSERLGLWSLIVSATSVANLANFGISNSLVAAVANAESKNEFDIIYDYTMVGVTLVGGTIGFLCCILFFLKTYIVKSLAPQNLYDISSIAFSYSLLCLFITSISGVLLGVIEGFHNLYKRNLVLIFTTSLYLILVFLLTPKFGLIGVIYAQVGQSILQLILSIALVFHELNKKVKRRPTLNNTQIYKKLVSSGFKFQLISLLSIFFDPLSKYLLSTYGGFSKVAYYEMANRLIAQLRQLIISSLQSLIPVIANLDAKNTFNVKKVYDVVFKIVLFVTFSMNAAIICSAPYISNLWINHFEPVFITSLIVLSIGWSFNIISTPAYYINVGLNKINPNLISTFILVALNMVLGPIIGKIFGGGYIIFSISASLLVGCFYLLNNFTIKNNISIKSILDKEEMALMLLLFILPTFMIWFELDHKSVLNIIFPNIGIVLLLVRLIFKYNIPNYIIKTIK